MKKIPNCKYDYKNTIVNEDFESYETIIINSRLRDGLCKEEYFKKSIMLNVTFDKMPFITDCVLIGCTFTEEYSEIATSILIGCKNVYKGNFQNSIIVDCDMPIFNTANDDESIVSTIVIDKKIYNIVEENRFFTTHFFNPDFKLQLFDF